MNEASIDSSSHLPPQYRADLARGWKIGYAAAIGLLLLSGLPMMVFFLLVQSANNAEQWMPYAIAGMVWVVIDVVLIAYMLSQLIGYRDGALWIDSKGVRWKHGRKKSVQWDQVRSVRQARGPVPPKGAIVFTLTDGTEKVMSLTGSMLNSDKANLTHNTDVGQWEAPVPVEEAVERYFAEYGAGGHAEG